MKKEDGMRFILCSVLAASVLVAANAAWAQNADDGQKIFKRACMVCHTNEAGKNKIGPSLFGVVGRKSGTAPGYQYSAAMKGASITWDDASLDKYLNDPKSTVPGNKMAFAGVKKAEERKDVIAYLSTLR